MKISVGVKNLTVEQLIRIIDTVDAETSISIKDRNREFCFGEILEPPDSKVKL